MTMLGGLDHIADCLHLPVSQSLHLRARTAGGVVQGACGVNAHPCVVASRRQPKHTQGSRSGMALRARSIALSKRRFWAASETRAHSSWNPETRSSVSTRRRMAESIATRRSSLARRTWCVGSDSWSSNVTTSRKPRRIQLTAVLRGVIQRGRLQHPSFYM